MGSTTTILFAFLGATMVSLATVPSAAAFDLTGHWEGKWSCSGLSAGVKDKVFENASTFAVTSFGNDSFAAIVDGGSLDDLTTAPPAEVGRWKVSTKGAKGTLSGLTVSSNGPNHVATCKYKYKRVDTINPNSVYSCSS